jgi:hypothetical protein
MLFATPDDVTAQQTAVKGYVTDLATAIQGCTGKNVSATVAQFVRVSKRAVRFLNEEPSWLNANSQYARGTAITKDLLPLYAELTAAGCSNVPAAPSLPAPDPDPASMLGGYGMLAGLALVFLISREMK